MVEIQLRREWCGRRLDLIVEELMSSYFVQFLFDPVATRVQRK